MSNIHIGNIYKGINRILKCRQLGRHVKGMAAFMLAAIVVVCAAGCSSDKSGVTVIPGSAITPAPKKGNISDIANNTDDRTLVGMLVSVDTTLKNMHFVDVESGTEYSVIYTGGTDIQDAYGKIKAAAVMQPGEIYDVYCNKAGKALKIYGSKDAWERNDISDITFDEAKKSITIGQTELTYTGYLLIKSGDEQISLAQLVKEDTLTLRGIGNKLYSITVDNGHGYIELTGVDAFEGGYITLGSRLFHKVSGNMMITAPVGSYDVEIQSADMKATRKVSIRKDDTTVLDFSEYTLPAAKKGTVNFSVTPAGAVMTIDGSEVDYSKPVSLSYGQHTVTLQANHYTTYTETFVVNSDYKTKVIDMTSTGSTATSSSTAKTTAASLTSGYNVKITAPEGAALYVDSVYIGIIPCTFSKTSGNKTITLSQSGYNNVSYTVAIPNTAGDVTYSFPAMTKGSSATEPTAEKPTAAEPAAGTQSTAAKSTESR